MLWLLLRLRCLGFLSPCFSRLHELVRVKTLPQLSQMRTVHKSCPRRRQIFPRRWQMWSPCRIHVGRTYSRPYSPHLPESPTVLHNTDLPIPATPDSTTGLPTFTVTSNSTTPR
ncbi:hypothetical protein JOM56_013336 [Amanita muscaria]